MNYDHISEEVVLRAFALCAGCGRKIEVVETLPGDSVRTGNHTQRASHWLESMRARVAITVDSRKWERLDDRKFRCAHCTAAEFDALGSSVTPRVAATEIAGAAKTKEETGGTDHECG